MSSRELWELSEQLTELGKCLSKLDLESTAPEIPALEIKGVKYGLQRFVYWNFLKFFWNSDLGHTTLIANNFDWYSPSNAKRFTKPEVEKLSAKNSLKTIFFIVKKRHILVGSRVTNRIIFFSQKQYLYS